MNQAALQSKESLFSRFAVKTFKFFASLKLAIFILATLISVLAAATFVESFHGADAARILIYESPWFAALLIVLAMNLAAAALDRLPWKKKHIGFVITHLGIIVILAGALVTQKTVVDGQMAMAEGETEYRISLPKPLLYIYSETDGLDWIFPLKKKAFSWHGREKLGKPSGHPDVTFPFETSVLSYYPKAKTEDHLQPAQNGPAAVELTLKSSFINQKQLLIENDPELGRVNLGPAKLVFSNTLLKENANPAAISGYIEAEKDGETFTAALPENPVLPLELPLDGTPYKIAVLEIYKNAAVSGNRLVEQKEADPNPAVEFLVKGPALEERHTAFARFPEFPTQHGMKPSATGLRFFYRLPGGGSRGERHELRFVQTSEGLKVQVRTGLEVKTLKAEPGAETPLGWMDLTYKIENYYPHAERVQKFVPVSETSQEDSPALELEVKTPAAPEKFWIGQGMRQVLTIGGRKYDFVFGEKKISAGFKLTLKDFRVENYPGTDRPASFESDVILKDDARGVVQNTTISMNKPLVYRGYRIYQASYSAEEGQPEISVFAIGRDSGVPIKYAGALIMVGGIVTMFFTRRPAKPLEPTAGES